LDENPKGAFLIGLEWLELLGPMTNYYYCLDCKKIIVNVNRDYGPICPKCKEKRAGGLGRSA